MVRCRKKRKRPNRPAKRGFFPRMPRCVKSAKGAAPKRIPYDPDREDRYISLNVLGFNSYRGYLKSKLWRQIRAQKLDSDPKCFCCKRNATQVHHRAYTLKAMRGHDMDLLMSVCGSCHEKHHRKGGSIANTTGTMLGKKGAGNIRRLKKLEKFDKQNERLDLLGRRKFVRQAKEGNLPGAGQGTIMPEGSSLAVPRRLRDRGET